MKTRTWADVLDFALGELGLEYEEFFDLHEIQYDWKVSAYNRQRARQMEPTRELMTLVHNMLADPGSRLKPYELMPLLTDPDRRLVEQADLAKKKSFWQRMKASKFFQTPTPLTPEK